MAWKVNDSKLIKLGRYTEEVLYLETHNGQDMKYSYMRLGEGVAILAFTDCGKIVLVEQFRPPVWEYKLEIPVGGLANGEDSLWRAKQELREETGYVSEDWELICDSSVLPGNSNAISTMFIARNCKFVGAMPEDGEDIKVRLVTEDEFEQLTLSNEMDFTIGKALYLHYLLRKNKS